MFWGMNLKPNRKYTQITSKNFHISQASLECEGLSENASNKIYINSTDEQKYLMCTLRKGSCEQTPLDLNFAEGDKICFQSIGSGNVSLTGYLTPNNYLFDDDGEEEEDEEEDEENLVDIDGNETSAQNGKGSKNKKKQKKPKAAEGSDEDTDDDEDDEEENQLLKAALESDDAIGSDEHDDEDDDGDEDEEDDNDEDDEDEDDDEVVKPKPKKAKIEKKESKQQQKQNGVQNAQKSKKEKKQEKQQKEKPQQQQQQNTTGGGERSLSGGVKIEDIRVGNGPEIKTGKRAQVYYEGRLKSNNKSFDSVKNGPPFKFNVGRGDVIKAWDVGIVGMKVGGKRRITCPPHMAYGARGSPPAIPPNSTLVFEVELKGVN